MDETEGIAGLFTEVKERGIEFDSHYSDLYIPVTKQTVEILERRGLRGTTVVQIFNNSIDGKPWFEIAFAYTPYWNICKP